MMYVKIARHDRLAFVPAGCLTLKLDKKNEFIEYVCEGRDESVSVGSFVLVDSRGGVVNIAELRARTPEEFFKRCLDSDCLFSGAVSSEFKMMMAVKTGEKA